MSSLERLARQEKKRTARKKLKPIKKLAKKVASSKFCSATDFDGKTTFQNERGNVQYLR